MNYFSYLPVEWLGLILMLVGALMCMISFGCNHAENEIIDTNSRTPWEWVDRLEARFAVVFNPIRAFVETSGVILVICGVGVLLLWFIGLIITKS